MVHAVGVSPLGQGREKLSCVEQFSTIFPKYEPGTTGRYRVTSRRFIRQVLTPNREALHGHVMLLDGASIHKATTTKHWLDSHSVSVLPDWPARSPHLNPVENLWSTLQGQVSDMGPETWEQLVACIRRAWKELPRELIRSLCGSFEGRLRRQVGNNGEPWTQREA